MTGFYIILGTIVLFAGGITLMDWFGQRQRRQREHKS